jgi:hypothetical protein
VKHGFHGLQFIESDSIGTTNNSASEAGAIYQRTIIKIAAGRVPTSAEEVLGTADVGKRIFLHKVW